MRLASVIYLSNQDVIGYPVGQVARSLSFVDEQWFLAGDEGSFRWLSDVARVEGMIVRQDHAISVVGDIPSMMGMALSLVRDHTDADFILVSQADELATPEVAAVIRGWMTADHLACARHCFCRIGFLYQDSGTGWGNTICGRDFLGEFRGDGLGFDEGGHAIGFLGDAHAAYLEIGSLSPELYFRHQSQHVKTWKEYGLMGPRLAAYPGAMDKDPLLRPWLQTAVSRDEFLRLSLTDGRKRIINRPLCPVESVDPRFTAVIDEMELRADCEAVHALVRHLGFDR